MTDVINGTADELPGDPADPVAAEVVPYQGTASTELIHADSPDELVEKATAIATTLDRVIRGQGLRTKVGKMKVQRADGSEAWEDRYHVNVEGWQALGTLTGVAIGQVTSRPLDDPVDYEVEVKHFVKGQRGVIDRVETYRVQGRSWEARVVVVRNGATVGVGEAMCSRTEPTWARRDDFAVRSMAITRATAKAYKQAAGWIVTLAGYSSTPAEEMPRDADTTAPAFGPAAEGDVVTAASTALTVLCGGDVEAARERWGAIKRLCDGYFPQAAAVALIAVAGPQEPTA